MVLPVRFVSQSSLFSPPRPPQAMRSAPSTLGPVACAHHVPLDVAHAPPARVRLQNRRLRTKTWRMKRTCRLFCRPSSSAAPPFDGTCIHHDTIGFDWIRKDGFEPVVVLFPFGIHPRRNHGRSHTGGWNGPKQPITREETMHACMHGRKE